MSLTNFPRSCISRLKTTSASFVRCEDGGATIWNLTWLLVFAGMAGLSIDSSNGWRNISISQSTSDAAALAGAMELPDTLDEVPFKDVDDEPIRDKALEYAKRNMPWEPYGQVLMRDEIFIGNWYNENGERRFTSGENFQDLVDAELYDSVDEIPVNAVRVYLFQDESDRGNGVATSLMHMAGMPYWTVVTTATAITGYPECAATAFMAKKKYCQTTNSEYGEDFCLWADEGFFLQNGNTWNGNVAQTPPGANNEGTKDQGEGFHLKENAPPMDVQFVEDIATWESDGTPGIAYDILSGGSDYAQKTTTTVNGATNRTAPTGAVVPLDVDLIGTPDPSAWLDSAQSVQVAGLDGFSSVAGLLGFAAQPGGIPPGCPKSRAVGSYVDPIGDYERDIFGRGSGDPEDEFPDVQMAGVAHGSRDLDPHKIYYHDDPKGLTIEGELESVVVVTRGPIKINGGSKLTDVTLVSLEEKKDGISMNGSVTFGSADDNCGEDGGVKMYAMSSVSGSSGAQFNGALIASGGSVGFAANANSEQGVVIYAAGNIFHTSNNIITTCGTDIQYDPDNRRHSLVD